MSTAPTLTALSRRRSSARTHRTSYWTPPATAEGTHLSDDAVVRATTIAAVRAGAGIGGVQGERVASARRDAARDWPTDDVSDAGRDSFPASDPPSWSPLRVGAPVAPEHVGPARA